MSPTGPIVVSHNEEAPHGTHAKAHGSVDWFQIDTDNPESTERFYGDLFDWTFAHDPGTPGYRLVTAKGADHPQGGVATGGDVTNRAAFFVWVSDVAAVVEHAEGLGGKVVGGPHTTPDGLTFAHLHDPAGNHFGVYSRPGS